MELSAWLFMLAIWALIIGNTGYCFYRLLTSERRLDDDQAVPPSTL